MKIAIVEMECHAEVLRAFVKLASLLDESESKYDFTIFTSNEIWKETKLDVNELNQFRLVAKQDKETLEEFLLLNLPNINQHELIVFNTLQENFSFYNKLNLLPPIWLRVHNTNFYFRQDDTKANDFSVSGVKLSFKKWIRRENKHKRQFLSFVNSFLFPNEVLSHWAVQHYNLNPKKVFNPTLPFTFVINEQIENVKKDNDYFIIGIIGAIDPERRDYDLLIQAMQDFIPKSQRKVQLILLGQIKGSFAEQILKSLKNLNPSKLEIISYHHLVDQDEFDRQITKIDVLLAPLKLETHFHVSKEFYGKTKVSGSVNDAIRQLKKIILPAAYGIEPDLEQLVLSYNNLDELVAHLVNLESQLADTKTSIPSNSYYLLENQLQILKRELEKIRK